MKKDKQHPLILTWSPQWCIALLAILSQLLAPLARETLALQRDDILSSHHWWQILSGHLLHLNWIHLLMNLAALWIIAYSFKPELKYRLTMDWSYLLFPMLGTSIGILWLSPELTDYVGLSGALHGYLVGLLLITWKRTPVWSSVFLIGILGKLIFERNGHDAWTAALIGGNVAYDAHLYGALSGWMVAVMHTALNRVRHARPETPPPTQQRDNQ